MLDNLARSLKAPALLMLFIGAMWGGNGGALLAALIAGTFCFCLGVAFARFISLPFMLRFLIQFTFQVDVSASISIEQYISFLLPETASGHSYPASANMA